MSVNRSQVDASPPKILPATRPEWFCCPRSTGSMDAAVAAEMNLSRPPSSCARPVTDCAGSRRRWKWTSAGTRRWLRRTRGDEKPAAAEEARFDTRSGRLTCRRRASGSRWTSLADPARPSSRRPACAGAGGEWGRIVGQDRFDFLVELGSGDGCASFGRTWPGWRRWAAGVPSSLPPPRPTFTSSRFFPPGGRH